MSGAAAKSGKWVACPVDSHPESWISGVPKPPVFQLYDFLDVKVTQDEGRVSFWMSGRTPTVESLMGLVLIASVREGKLIFGAVHQLWMDGPDAPFKTLFEVEGVDLSLIRQCEVSGVLSLCVEQVLPEGFSGDVDEVICYFFTFVKWDDFLNPQKWQKKLSKSAF